MIEARLESSVKHYNKLKHGNIRLMEHIDDKRSARLQLNSAWKKLQDDVSLKHREIKAISASADEAKEVLDEARMRREEIRKMLDGERKGFKEGIIRMRDDIQGKVKEKKEYDVKMNREQRKTAREFLRADEEEALEKRSS